MTWPRVMRFAGVVLTLIGLLGVRVIYEGEQQIVAGTEALKKGQPAKAITHSARAAQWYVPGAPHVGVAYRRLTRIAEEAERHGRNNLAIQAWSALRSSSLSTRWLITPHEKTLRRANQEIARLRVAGDETTFEQGPAVASALRALSNDAMPRRQWVAVLVVGFFTFSGGLFVAAGAMAGPFGELRWQAAKRPLLVTVAGLIAWALALWRA